MEESYKSVYVLAFLAIFSINKCRWKAKMLNFHTNHFWFFWKSLDWRVSFPYFYLILWCKEKNFFPAVWHGREFDNLFNEKNDNFSTGGSKKNVIRKNEKLFSRKLVATAKSQVLNLFHIIVKKLILHVK